MKFGVVIFPGSNCDQDLIYVLENTLKQEVVKLWHKNTTIPEFKNKDCILLPGGFAYGDYLRAGAIARFSPVMEKVISFAKDGGYVFGICNGFQILCEAGLLPGTLLKNDQQKFSCKNVYIAAQTNKSPITLQVPVNKALKIPIAHSEGRYYADSTTLNELKNNNQILFKYCDEFSNITNAANPNGALDNIAGICNVGRNVFGMMPHPERAADELLGNIDGKIIFNSLLNQICN